jgi:ABC-type enterochelin transport system permease subunit
MIRLYKNIIKTQKYIINILGSIEPAIVSVCWDKNTSKILLGILSLGCSVIFVASFISMFIFFTYAILAGLHYSCIQTIDFVTPFVIYLSKHHHYHHQGLKVVRYLKLILWVVGIVTPQL